MNQRGGFAAAPLIIALAVVAAVGGYIVLKPQLWTRTSEVVVNVDPAEVTKEAFEVECAAGGGEYRERIFYGIGPVPYAECGYRKAADGGRLCSSSAPAEKATDDCDLCEFGASYGPAAGDFGPMHGRCAEYETLYRLAVAQINETFGWQTYQNDDYGVEFKYPNGWYSEQAPTAICSTSGEVTLLCLGFDKEENRGRQELNSYGQLFLKVYGEDNLASAFQNQYEQAEYFNGQKIKEVLIDSFKTIVLRGSCYECYGATDEELRVAQARIFSLTCDTRGTVCARFIFSGNANYESNKNFFLDQFLPTLMFGEKFNGVEYQHLRSRG